MKRFIAKLLGIPMPVIAVFNSVEWTRDDSVVLKDFLETQVGKKLISTMTNHEYTASSLACQKEERHRDFVCGEASGLRKQKNMILMMATVQEEQSVPRETVRGPADMTNDQKDEVDQLIRDSMREPILGDY